MHVIADCPKRILWTQMGDSTILQTFYDGTLKNECTALIHFNKKMGTIEIHHKENTLCASHMRCGGNGMTAILCRRCCCCYCPLFLFFRGGDFSFTQHHLLISSKRWNSHKEKEAWVVAVYVLWIASNSPTCKPNVTKFGNSVSYSHVVNSI